MKNYSRCREKMEGRVGRWRRYMCQSCDKLFDRFLLRPLPKGARFCDECLKRPEIRSQYDEAFALREIKEKE